MNEIAFGVSRHDDDIEHFIHIKEHLITKCKAIVILVTSQIKKDSLIGFRSGEYGGRYSIHTPFEGNQKQGSITE